MEKKKNPIKKKIGMGKKKDPIKKGLGWFIFHNSNTISCLPIKPFISN